MTSGNITGEVQLVEQLLGLQLGLTLIKARGAHLEHNAYNVIYQQLHISIPACPKNTSNFIAILNRYSACTFLFYVDLKASIAA